MEGSCQQVGQKRGTAPQTNKQNSDRLGFCDDGDFEIVRIRVNMEAHLILRIQINNTAVFRFHLILAAAAEKIE
jgi:hypothetical protein